MKIPDNCRVRRSWLETGLNGRKKLELPTIIGRSHWARRPGLLQAIGREMPPMLAGLASFLEKSASILPNGKGGWGRVYGV